MMREQGTPPSRAAFATAAVLALLAGAAPGFAQEAPTPGPCAKVWVGHEAEYEELLRSEPVDRREKISVGITHPERVFFAPGLKVASAAWKPLLPGKYAGFQESYRSEIAAYELDKLIELHMVPPTVERKIGSSTGALVLWVENVSAWDVNKDIRGPDKTAWARELVRMKIFDQLSGNIDRNQGNLLYDAEYHVVLIDHSRAFVDTVDLTKYQKYLFVDQPLWERIQALTMESLQPALGKWVSKGALIAVLQRRDKMRVEIDKMHAARGEAMWLR
jgi:hypothetical protein